MNRVDLMLLIARWYTLGIHDSSGQLYLPIPDYDYRTIVAYARGHEAAELYGQLLAESGSASLMREALETYLLTRATRSSRLNSLKAAILWPRAASGVYESQFPVANLSDRLRSEDSALADADNI